MNIYVNGSIWLVAGALVGALTAHLVRRFGPTEGRLANNDANGQVFTVIGGLHALLVAFVLLSLVDEVREARNESFHEASRLVEASWAAESLPGPIGGQVHELSKAYADGVAKREWPQMHDGCQVTGPGWEQLDEIRSVIAVAETNDDWQVDRKVAADNYLADVFVARQERLAAADDDGVGAVVWFVLIFGSAITIVLANLFGGTRRKAHIVIMTTLTGVIALMLFAIYQLQSPYSGDASIGPEAFQWAIDRMK